MEFNKIHNIKQNIDSSPKKKQSDEDLTLLERKGKIPAKNTPINPIYWQEIKGINPKFFDIQRDGEQSNPYKLPHKIEGKEILLNPIRLEDGTSYIERQNIKLSNGQTFRIRAITIKRNGSLEISRMILPNGNVSNIELDPRFVYAMRMYYGRELTNIDVLTTPVKKKPIIDKLSVEAQEILNSLKDSDEKKFELVSSLLKRTFLLTKSKDGVSNEYITSFIRELSQIENILLQNMIDNEISIKIYDDMFLFPESSHAEYRHSKKPILEDGKPRLDKFGAIEYELSPKTKEIIFAEKANNQAITINGVEQNTYESLAHEMAHAFDYNQGRLLNLQKQDFISIINGENFSRFIDMPSFSKEFDNAITADLMHMFEIDEKEGKPQGQTFKELLKDNDFKYYFGVYDTSDDFVQFNDVTARKELFAQMVSYVTSGKLTNKNFQARIEELFPNCLDFTRKILLSTTQDVEQNS